MSQISRERLTPEGLRAGLALLSGWNEQDGKIEKTFEFSAYWDGVLFASSVARIAEEMDHHPDLLITYQKVSVKISTHDAGGLTPLDLEFARRAEELRDNQL